MTLTDTYTSSTPASSAPASSIALAGRHWTGAPLDSPWIALAHEIAPTLRAAATEHDRAGTFVRDGIDLLRLHGAPAMLVPTELGGGGVSHAETGAFLAELAHACPNTSLAFSMHSHLVAAQVWRHHRELPAPVLPKVVASNLILVSTGAADWIDSNGTALKVDGGYRVTARKSPASGAPSGDIVVTSFRWDDAPDGPQVLHAAIPFSAEGVSIETTWDTLGMRGTGSETVVLDDVFVPDASIALARPAGQWHPVWATVIGSAMPLIMASYVGVAEAAADEALTHAASRADRPDTAPLAGRLMNRLTAARDAVGAMFTASDNLRFDNSTEVAATMLSRKSNAAEACLDVVRLAMELAGGAAFSRSNPIERLFRDAQGAVYHPLPTAQQERFSGRVALGMLPL